jgi:hypothetical protein
MFVRNKIEHMIKEIRKSKEKEERAGEESKSGDRETRKKKR